MEIRTFRFGAWRVDPSDNSISNGEIRRQMEPLAMKVLVTLCNEANTIISSEQLLTQCWGSKICGDNPVHKIITRLRKLLGDKSNAPEYIETIRKRGYRSIARVQYDYSETSHAGTWIHESPFRGLLAFDEKHAPIFFGRSDAITRLIQSLTLQAARPNAVDLHLILGPSGAGKTSLVRAGVIPSLMHAKGAVRVISHSYFDLAERAEHSLNTCLGAMLLDLEQDGQGLFPNQSTSSLAQLLQGDLTEIQNTLKAQLSNLPEPSHVRHCVIIDRLEVIFDESRVPTSECEAFLSTLEQLAQSQALLILLICRNDFYPQIAKQSVLINAKARGAHFDVSSPTSAEIAQMIRLPAIAARLTFGIDPHTKTRLDDVICQDINGNPDALPLLQYTLNELYQHRTTEGELSFTSYQELGGIEGAIGRRAEQVILQLSEIEQQSVPKVLSLVATISTTDALVSGRRASWCQLTSVHERSVVNSLVDSRLFVSESVAGEPSFGVSHEALLRRWPRAAEWIQSHQNAIQVSSRISELAHRWQVEPNQKNKTSLLLPDGVQLQEASRLLSLSTFSLATEQSAFIHASLIHAARRKRIRRLALSGFILLLLTAVGFAISALTARKHAQERPVVVERLMSTLLANKDRSLSAKERNEALNYFTQTEQSLNPSEISQRPKTLIALGITSMRNRDPIASQAAFEAAQVILQQQLALRSSDQALLSLAVKLNFQMGLILKGENKYLEARDKFKQMQTHADHLVSLAPQNRDYWALQARAHFYLGNMAHRLEQLERSDQEYTNAIQVMKRVLKVDALSKKAPKKERQEDDEYEFGNESEGAELVESLYFLGHLKTRMGKFQEALQLHQEEATLKEARYRANPNDDILGFAWTRALHAQAGVHLAMGQNERALAIFQQSDAILQTLVKRDPSQIDFQGTHIGTLMNIQALNALNESKRDPKKSWTELQKIKDDLHQAALLNDKGVYYNKRFLALLNAQHQINSVNQALEFQIPIKSTAAIIDIDRSFASAVNTKSGPLILIFETILIAQIKLARANYEWARGDKTAAYESCIQARDTIKDKMPGSQDYELLVPWRHIHHCLGQTDIVKQTEKTLEKIGYRDRQYLKMIEEKKSHFTAPYISIFP